jgi:peptidoglycan/LPS O-acetylase OafA/YrhL
VSGGIDAKPARRPPVAAARLAWLDALRGIAALCVVYDHLGVRVLPEMRTQVTRVFDPGLYGVLVFFLISGYIVPASLERKGDVRAFWINRVFRLFPLFATVICGALLLHMLGLSSLRGMKLDTAAALSHLFMLSDLLGGNNLIMVLWTLSYEMVFYLLLTALFTSGWHRFSGRLAMTFAAGALLLGGILPIGWLTYRSTIGPAQLAEIADVLTVGGLAVAVTSRGLPRRLGAWLAAATGLILVGFNSHRFVYEGLTILALMFTGTMLYRAQHRQVRRLTAIAVVGGVFAAVLAAGAWHVTQFVALGAAPAQQRIWIITVLAAGLTFAGGLMLQRLRVPSVLAWLGLVSYSIYLIFPLLLDVYDSIPFPQRYQQLSWLQAGAGVAFMAALLGCAALTYRLVEAPMQRLGRRLVTRLEGRKPGPARGPAGSGATQPSALPAPSLPSVLRPAKPTRSGIGASGLWRVEET